MAWLPKWVVAGPVNTNVMFENGTNVPPEVQTCSIDGRFFSNGADSPLPVMKFAVAVIAKRAEFAGELPGHLLRAGFSPGQTGHLAHPPNRWEA
jgi:hypothetical protein